MTREEIVADLKKRAAKERTYAKEYTKMRHTYAVPTERMDQWAAECLAEAEFFDRVVEELGA